LKDLTDIDLRYTRVTSNGIESLRATLPNLKVQFVGSATVRPKSAGSAKRAAIYDGHAPSSGSALVGGCGRG